MVFPVNRKGSGCGCRTFFVNLVATYNFVSQKKIFTLVGVVSPARRVEQAPPRGHGREGRRGLTGCGHIREQAGRLKGARPDRGRAIQA